MRMVQSPMHWAVTRPKQAVFLVRCPLDRIARPGFHFERRNCVRERFFPKKVCLVHFLDSRITCVVCCRNQICKRWVFARFAGAFPTRFTLHGFASRRTARCFGRIREPWNSLLKVLNIIRSFLHCCQGLPYPLD